MRAASVLALCLWAAPASAQTRLVIGRADDSLTTQPVKSGVVQVLGTSIQTPINYDGTFALYAPIREVTLQLRSVGYQAREVRVPERMQAVQTTLLRDHFKMEEIVVTGLGTGVDRRNLAHAIGEIRQEDLTRLPVSSVDQVLSGRITGANVRTTGSAPGGGLQITLRGVTSILGAAGPLFIVDGVVVSNATIPAGTNAITRGQAGVIASPYEDALNRIADLNPNDIERIDVLKGAAAAAMYGSRASNGVILITTKRGRAQ